MREKGKKRLALSPGEKKKLRPFLLIATIYAVEGKFAAGDNKCVRVYL